MPATARSLRLASTSSAVASTAPAATPKRQRPLFESAHGSALRAEQHFVAADAAQMAALVAPGRDACVTWTTKGIDVAEAHEGAAYSIGPLLNNLGWGHHEAGEYEPAPATFQRALEARERDAVKRRAGARAVRGGKTLRVLGRSADAIRLLERAVGRAGRGRRTAGTTRSSPWSTRTSGVPTMPACRPGSRSRS